MKMHDENFFKSIRDFLEVYLIQHKNYSKNTQKSYRTSLSLLLEYFKNELNIPYTEMGFEHLTYENISNFLIWLEKTRGCSIQTVNLRLMGIRSFAKYTSITDPSRIYFQVEISNLDTKKSSPKVVEFLSEEALKVLLEQPNTGKKNGARDAMFMLLMYDLGARLQELLDLRISDIEIGKVNSTAYLVGKGSKARRVPISDSVATCLTKYMDDFHPKHCRNNENFLFYTTIHGTNGKMSPDAVSLFMRNYGKKARGICLQVPEKVHPHQLRHTRAMHLYRKGMPLVLLSEFLGHANVDTTRIYAWADTEMKRKAIEKISPDTDKALEIPIWDNDEVMIKKLYGLI